MRLKNQADSKNCELKIETHRNIDFMYEKRKQKEIHFFHIAMCIYAK